MTACRARVFVGLALGADLGGAVAARVAEVLDPAEYRLARAEGLHLTLHYVGSLARERCRPWADPWPRAWRGSRLLS